MSLSFPKIWHLGTPQAERIWLGSVEITEKLDGCVGLNSLILCSDLTYKRAESLKIGDRLLAFDEKASKLVESKVTYTKCIKKYCYLVSFKDRSIIATHDHPWLLRDKAHKRPKGSSASKLWKKTNELSVGDKIVSLPIWEYEDSWESGWVAGNYDGEGSLVTSGQTRRLSYYQAVGPVLTSMTNILKERGFDFSVDVRRRQENWKDVGSVNIRGGWPEILRHLGTFRPLRLLEKAQKVWLNRPLNGVGDSEVVSISYVGPQWVLGLSTSSKTYIANGLFSHNSQFCGGFVEDKTTGFFTLRMRSKGAELLESTQDKLFKPVVAHFVNQQYLIQENYPNYWFYGETLAKVKHNTLEYERVPLNNFALFGAKRPNGDFVFWDELEYIAAKLQVDVVPLIFSGVREKLELEELKTILDRESYLGKAKIEGIVIKNYAEQLLIGGQLVPLLAAKYVSEEFKEKHSEGWASYADKWTLFMESFRTEARWKKAVQHLREKGELTLEPKDIGNLLKEINVDFLEEAKQDWMEGAFKHYWKDQSRVLTRGFPEWYKEQLVKGAWNL